jgi:hypothetical protein
VGAEGARQVHRVHARVLRQAVEAQGTLEPGLDALAHPCQPARRGAARVAVARAHAGAEQLQRQPLQDQGPRPVRRAQLAADRSHRRGRARMPEHDRVGAGPGGLQRVREPPVELDLQVARPAAADGVRVRLSARPQDHAAGPAGQRRTRAPELVEAAPRDGGQAEPLVHVQADAQARRVRGLGATGGGTAALGQQVLRPGGQRQERRRHGHRGSIAAPPRPVRGVPPALGAFQPDDRDGRSFEAGGAPWAIPCTRTKPIST